MNTQVVRTTRYFVGTKHLELSFIIEGGLNRTAPLHGDNIAAFGIGHHSKSCLGANVDLKIQTNISLTCIGNGRCLGDLLDTVFFLNGFFFRLLAKGEELVVCIVRMVEHIRQSRVVVRSNANVGIQLMRSPPDVHITRTKGCGIERQINGLRLVIHQKLFALCCKIEVHILKMAMA